MKKIFFFKTAKFRFEVVKSLSRSNTGSKIQNSRLFDLPSFLPIDKFTLQPPITVFIYFTDVAKPAQRWPEGLNFIGPGLGLSGLSNMVSKLSMHRVFKYSGGSNTKHVPILDGP